MFDRLFFAKHLEDDEHLLRVVHKYWLLGVRVLFWPTLLLVLPWVLFSFVQHRALLTISSIITVIVGIWWLRSFFDYFLDAWIITDHGIIDVAWFGWFHRQSTRVLYSDLQGVSYEVHGVLATLLRFGTVSVEKISNGQTVTLEYVSRPKRIELLILKAMETYLHSKNLKDATHVQEILSALVAEKMQLKELEEK